MDRNPGVRTQLRDICSGGFLVFQRGGESLGHTVISASSLATQAQHKAQARERASEVVARVPAAATREEQRVAML